MDSSGLRSWSAIGSSPDSRPARRGAWPARSSRSTSRSATVALSRAGSDSTPSHACDRCTATPSCASISPSSPGLKGTPFGPTAPACCSAWPPRTACRSSSSTRRPAASAPRTPAGWARDCAWCSPSCARSWARARARPRSSRRSGPRSARAATRSTRRAPTSSVRAVRARTCAADPRALSRSTSGPRT